MTLYILTLPTMGHSAPRLPGTDDAKSTDPSVRPGRLLISTLVASMMAALISFPLSQIAMSKPGEPPDPGGTAQKWLVIHHPMRLFGLQSPEFGNKPSLYQAKRNADGARLDRFAFNELGGERPYLQIDVERTRDGVATVPLAADLGKLAEEGGRLISASTAQSRIETSFGMLDYAELKLALQPSPAACLGFRLRRPDPGLVIRGLACAGATRQMPTPGTVACVVERLNLNVGGDDRALIKLFVAANLRRDRFCNGSKYIAPRADLASVANVKPTEDVIYRHLPARHRVIP